MTGFAFAYAVMRACGGQPRKNPGAPELFDNKVTKHHADLTVLVEKAESEFIHFKEELTELFSNKSRELSESINQYNSTIQKRMDEMLALSNQVEQNNTIAFKRMKKWIFWGGISIVAFSCMINILFRIIV